MQTPCKKTKDSLLKLKKIVEDFRHGISTLKKGKYDDIKKGKERIEQLKSLTNTDIMNIAIEKNPERSLFKYFKWIKYSEGDDMSSDNPLGAKHPMAKIEEKDYRTYGYNNSFIAINDNKGNLYVGTGNTEDRNRRLELLEKLEKAGYKDSGIFVPLSNGEIPNDPEKKKILEEMREDFMIDFV